MRLGAAGVVCLLSILIAACAYPPLERVDAGDHIDACVSLTTKLDTCQLTFDGDLMVMGMATYDTDSHVLSVVGSATPTLMFRPMMIDGDPVDVIAARNVRIAVSTSLRGTGSRALVIVARDTLTVEDDSLIDVGVGGAGARISCANGAMPGTNNIGGAGGGGGGAYGADGGNGGSGNTNTAAGGAKGQAMPVPPGLRGGCPGAPGGTGIGGAPGGASGRGGGAMYLVAGSRISLGNIATLTAGGGGGGGGVDESGGGGGGSGGMIVLEAPQIVGPNGRVAANGGGGGEGSSAAQPGGAGAKGTNTMSRASGGSGMSLEGSDGGDGGSVLGTTGVSVTASVGGAGGGGGGGVGFIQIVSASMQIGIVSPQPQ